MDPAEEEFDPHFMTTRLNATQAAGKHLCYKLRVQFQEDPCKQPIENASVKWGAREYEMGELRFDSSVSGDENPRVPPRGVSAVDEDSRL